jgi:hypothetical protein
VSKFIKKEDLGFIFPSSTAKMRVQNTKPLALIADIFDGSVGAKQKCLYYPVAL